MNVLLIDAWDRWYECAAARRENAGLSYSVCHAALVDNDFTRSRSMPAIFTPRRVEMLFLLIPLNIVQYDLVGRFLTGQHQREEDTDGCS